MVDQRYRLSPGRERRDQHDTPHATRSPRLRPVASKQFRRKESSLISMNASERHWRVCLYLVSDYTKLACPARTIVSDHCTPPTRP